jgi:large-conductance mechanosensitive channel
LRKSTLSYQILKIHRNKYISFLVVFTFLTTVVFFWIKERRYEMEERYKEELAKLETASRQQNDADPTFFD